jgi:hypothetical protein
MAVNSKDNHLITINNLPVELVSIVASFVGNQRTIMSGLGYTSRYFRSAVKHDPSLQRHFCENDLCVHQMMTTRCAFKNELRPVSNHNQFTGVHRMSTNECFSFDSVFFEEQVRTSPVHTLHCRYYKIDSDTLNLIDDYMATNTRLYHFQLKIEYFTPISQNTFGEFLRTNTTLRSLKLEKGIYHQFDLLNLTKSLAVNTTLRSLILDTAVSVEAMTCLVESLKTNTTLKSLSFHYPGYHLHLFAEMLETNRGLTSLSYTGLSNNQVELIATALTRNTTIRYVAFKSCLTKKSAMLLIPMMQQNPRLIVDVSENRIPEDHPIWEIIAARTS